MELYRHSGRSGALGIPIASAVGLVAALVLAAIYTVAIVWIPIVFLNCLLTVAFGLGIGAAVGWGAMIGKVRNPMLTGVLGFVVGTAGVYFAWVIDPAVRFADLGVRLTLDVNFLIDYIKVGFDEGFWAITNHGGKGDNVKGIFLALVWLGEAGIVIGGATWLAGRFFATQPFCEEDNCWTTSDVGVALLLPWEPTERAFARLMQGELAALGELIRADNDAADHLRLDLATCPACTESNYLTIQQVTHTLDKKGNVQMNVTPLIQNLRVPHEDLPRIREAGRELTDEERQKIEAAQPAAAGDFATQRQLRQKTAASGGQSPGPIEPPSPA